MCSALQEHMRPKIFGRSGFTLKVKTETVRGTSVSLENNIVMNVFFVDQLAVADARSVLVTVTCYDADGNVYGSVTDSVESYFAPNSTSSGLDSAIVLLADSAYEYLH